MLHVLSIMYSLFLHILLLLQHDLVHIFGCQPALQMPRHLRHRVAHSTVSLLPCTSRVRSLSWPPQSVREDTSQGL